MGLLDMIQGMTNAPRAQGTGSSRMSPIAMGLLALLAYKALHGGNTPASTPSTGGGGLMASLENALGGGSVGDGAGTIVSGGLNQLINRLQQGGLGGVVSSWIGNGPNQPISPGDLEKAAGSDTLDTLAKEAGISRPQLLERLTAELPQTVDHLTPQGRIPTEQEAAQAVKSS